jgi:hypothetical protein
VSAGEATKLPGRGAIALSSDLADCRLRDIFPGTFEREWEA